MRQKLPHYEQLPDVVKTVLLDMAYNLGPTGLLTGYPHIFEAIEIGAWPQAAAESEREGISAARNTWAREQFLSALESIRVGTVTEIRAETESLEETARTVGLWGRLRGLLFGK